MKKLYKLSILVLFLFFPLFVYAKSDEDYKIESVYMNMEVDIVGSIQVKEAIVVDGSLDVFKRKINYRDDSLEDWVKGNIDFNNSSIYDANAIAIKTISSLKVDKDTKIDWNILNSEWSNYDKVDNPKEKDGESYTYNDDNEEIEIKIYEPNNEGKIVYFLEYSISQVAVLHNDIAELYYNVFSMDKDIGSVNIQITTPSYSDKDDFRLWVHGPENGLLNVIEGENDTYLGGVIKVDDYKSETPIKVRMLFDKKFISLIPALLKNSKVDAKDEVIAIEEELTSNALKKKNISNITYYGTSILAISYLIGLIFLWAYMYKKYDCRFNIKQGKEFIDEYDIDKLEYLMKKDITINTFKAEVMNLIYKKVISIEKNKKDIILVLKKKTSSNQNDAKIIEILFDTVGDGKKVTLREIEDFSSKPDNIEKFKEQYDIWKSETIIVCEEEKFFEKDNTKRIISSIYFILGMMIFIFLLLCKVKYYVLYPLVLGGAISFIIYIWSFKKRTKNGQVGYLKSKGFKKFLLKSESYDDNKTNKVELWDRYLIYATIFNIVECVEKTIENKLTLMDLKDDYIKTSVFYNENFDILNSINNSISSFDKLV